MEPANSQRALTALGRCRTALAGWRPSHPASTGPLVIEAEFLSDAEAIEARPIMHGIPVAIWAMAGLLTAAVTWASLAQIDRVINARGKLATIQGTMVVQPFETSIVRRIDVRPGQVVHKGDVLGALDPTFTSADTDQLRQRRASLDAQVARLEAEVTDTPYTGSDNAEERLQRRLFDERFAAREAQRRKLDEQAAQFAATLSTNQHDREVLSRRLDGTRQIEGMQQQLQDRALGSKLKLLESSDQRMAVERDLAQTVNHAEEIRRQLAAAQAARAGFDREWQQKAMEDLVSARRDRDLAAEQLAKAERKSELVALTAPDDAVVLEVAKRSVGSVVREAEPLITLVPLDAPLEADVRIGAGDVGLLRTGDPARIKLDAFPFQRHGTVSASLATISEDAFSRDQAEGQQQAPANAEKGAEEFYRGRLDLGPVTLRNLDPHVRLLPGMSLTAEIVIGRRSVISYLLYPVMKGFDEALREP